MTTRAEQRVLLVGGSSEIGLAIVRRLSALGPVRPSLLGRDKYRLAQAASTLAGSAYGPADSDLVQAEDIHDHADVIDRAFKRSGGFEIVILAIGVLGAQAGLDADSAEAEEVMRVNFLGGGSLLINCLRALRDQGSGTLVVLSSVAAERPRRGNAIYGAAKAGLDALAQGLADAAWGSGARVLVVRPGFVQTRMTAGLPVPPLATTADAVANATVKAIGGSAHTIWVPARLRFVFAVLRHLPRRVVRRIPL
jgi:decaprenylphospho-beta-D-erythro-pentofuranosid-2-ulose 2-reductase